MSKPVHQLELGRDVGRKVSRPKRLAFSKPLPNHAQYCAKSTGIPGDCSCHRSATARSLRTLADIAAGKRRCGEILREEKPNPGIGDGIKVRTWRCQISRGHIGPHEHLTGHRRWAQAARGELA
jgi:hypothetical protein